MRRDRLAHQSVGLLCFLCFSRGGRVSDIFKECFGKKVPVVLFDMVINTPDGSTKITLKLIHKDFRWWPARMGEKAVQFT